MTLQQWAIPQLSKLLPGLDNESLEQIVSYTQTLPSNEEIAGHLQNLLGDSPDAAEFISSFITRRSAPADSVSSHANGSAKQSYPVDSKQGHSNNIPSSTQYGSDSKGTTSNGQSSVPPLYAPPSYAPPSQSSTRALRRPHTNKVIEAARIRARDEQDMQQALQDIQYKYQIYNAEIEPEHETEYYCACPIHMYNQRKYNRLGVQDMWSKAVMYPGEKAYNDCYQMSGALFSSNPYRYRVISPYGRFNTSSYYYMQVPRADCHAQSIHETIALNNQLNKQAQAEVAAMEPKVNIWNDDELEHQMSALSIAATADKKRSLENGSQETTKKTSKLSSFRASLGIKSSEERAAGKVIKQIEKGRALRDEIIAEENGRWPDQEWRQIVAAYQEKVGMTYKIAELRMRSPLEYLHLLRAGYFEPIPVAWAGAASNPLKFTIEAAGGWRGITPSWRGYEDTAEERLYWVLNHREGSVGMRMKPDFISEMNMARARMASAVEPPPEYFSPNDTCHLQHTSAGYSKQVMPAPFKAYDRPEQATDDTMILLDVSGSMDFDPVRPNYDQYLITGYSRSTQPKNKDVAKAIIRRFTDAMTNHDHMFTGYDLVTFSTTAHHIGTINHENLNRMWNSVRIGGGTRVMTGWQKVKELHFQKHCVSAVHHPIYGWQAGPETPMLRLLLLLDGEATDMDEFELDLLGLSWAHVTIFLIGVDGCPHHHRHANELQRISDVNHHVSFVDAQGNTPERFVTHELLKRHLGYEMSMTEFAEIEELPASHLQISLGSAFPSATSATFDRDLGYSLHTPIHSTAPATLSNHGERYRFTPRPLSRLQPTLATIADQTAHLQPGFDTTYASLDGRTPATPALNGDNYGQKRGTPPSRGAYKPSKKVKRIGPRSDVKPDATVNGEGDKDGDGSASKPKRVRTGCLTCRERHLKCDEAMPHCNNCKKSNRQCKRGVRLNFIDTLVERPPTIVTLYGRPGWKVEFRDESREIASEYQGGMEKYKPLLQDRPSQLVPDPNMAYEFASAPPQAAAQPALPSIQGTLPETFPDQSHHPDMGNPFEPKPSRNSSVFVTPAANSEEAYNGSIRGSIAGQSSVSSFNGVSTDMVTPEDEKKDFLDNAEDTLFMQVFVEEVGLWMDSMDPQKHFSRLLPFHSLSEPMLLNAFLACGARHLALVNSAYTEDKALHYYDTATRYLLKNLQNPNRDTVICATTAVILNVYEIMSERALQRMNHIAGARALIKECNWNARAQGIGAACFWLNVGLEVLSCLHFNWQVAWDPDDWGVDMDFSREIHNGREEVWTHRMLYVCAKVCNFRATIPRFKETDVREQQTRLEKRYAEWNRLKAMCDAWNDGIPRTMHPMAYIYPYQTSSKSAFPEVWLVKRSTIVARLFFHTAQLLMSQINPYFSIETPEMADLQRRHSQMICGIAAHVKDRGVASVAIRSLAHAAEPLTDRREQEEVIQIFERINKETGWRIGFVYKELKERWGWQEEPSPQQFAQTHTAVRQQHNDSAVQAVQQQQQHAQQQQMLQEQAQQAQHQQHNLQLQQSFTSPTQQQNMQSMAPVTSNVQAPTVPAPPMSHKRPPTGIPNPMYAKADFNLPQHPYQNFYVAPNHNAFTASQQGGLMGNQLGGQPGGNENGSTGGSAGGHMFYNF
ncbi:Hypothetical protein R9X50_00730200 [Acrodontium crateriforme]|uniref:Zn(2)-C6 fungal-type domain-containing protein n=1 Tax=Acrodontium crateriforme TaxID=150365 RepID=A0AAQ3RC45_9PEZI|nr:Hypothetical protein R9X50_00730200 [Acrodontium crateriforme]